MPEVFSSAPDPLPVPTRDGKSPARGKETQRGREKPDSDEVAGRHAVHSLPAGEAFSLSVCAVSCGGGVLQ